MSQAYLEQILSEALELLRRQPAQLIAVVGPTATGKTNLALSLASELGLEIINADSRLIYREMNIGTAKPSLEELSLTKHHLIDIKSPAERYSAAEYQRDLDKTYMSLVPVILSDNPVILSEAKDPPKPRAIVVGGTGLYLRTALENLDLPGIPDNPELRAKIKSKFETQGLNALVTELLDMDPEASGLIDLKNHVRVMRALESMILSGKSLAQLRRKLDNNRYEVLYLGLNYNERPEHYSVIDSRVHNMIDDGLVAEVEGLLSKYGETDTLHSTIGYAEIIEHLQGNITLDQAISKIQQSTRNYAKRQNTWFKNNKKINWFYR
jgi:tRNA dimethylallyltransferase